MERLTFLSSSAVSSHSHSTVVQPLIAASRPARSSSRHTKRQTSALRNGSQPGDVRPTRQSAATLDAPPAQQPETSTSAGADGRGTADSQFDWNKQWYPIQAVEDLDAAKPHAAKLLGRELVLWRDGQGTWRALEDLCSHRKVPLSEGRIEPSNGTLMCSFHGWCFDGEGKCTNIPTCAHIDPAAEKAACNSQRSRVASYPTQEREGLLWVWGESGPTAFVEAFATPMASNDLYASYPKDTVERGFNNYVRDVPGSIDCWIDNMTDQSHGQFAHNGAAGNPSKELLTKGDYKGFPALIGDTPEKGILYSFNGNLSQDKPTGHFVFKPPVHTGLPVGPEHDKAGFSLWIYTTPTGANSTRLIINSARDTTRHSGFQRKGLQKIVASLLSPIFTSRWWRHLFLHNIDDGDQVLLHKQNTTYAGLKEPFNRATFSPSTSDRGSVAFRRWWSTFGNNGPEYADADTVRPDTRLGNDPNFRRELLDRYSQHTHHCSACSGALKNVRLLLQAAQYAAYAAGAALVIALSRGAAYISPVSASLSVVAVLALFARKKLQKLESRFVFTDWRHADIA